MTGMFATSLAGHDKGQIYVIIKEEDEYVYLADGHIRKVEKPKKKKKKHVQIIKTGLDAQLTEKIRAQETVYNEEIRHALKNRAK